MTLHGFDPALDAVVATVERLDPDGSRTADVLRRTYDQLYDGIHTRRFRWDQLYKTEKTHFGTLVEINLQREFQYDDGEKLDYKIAGHEVDAKYSDSGAWMLPPEAVGELCMVVTASDHRSVFSLGVVRARPELLNLGQNRDAKKTLNAQGRQSIRWLYRDRDMPENLLLHLPQETLDAIWAKGPHGQPMVNEAFRLVPNRIFGRAAVETLARQLDPVKRVRGNNGARTYLQPEGIIIVSGDEHWQRQIARSLEIEIPVTSSDFVSAYVRPASDDWRGPKAQIGTGWWRLATRETVEGPAPVLLPPGCANHDEAKVWARLQRRR